MVCNHSYFQYTVELIKMHAAKVNKALLVHFRVPLLYAWNFNNSFNKPSCYINYISTFIWSWFLDNKCSYMYVVGSRVRLATLELAILLLKQLVHAKEQSPVYIQDQHLAWIESAREESILVLRNFYKVYWQSRKRRNVWIYCLLQKKNDYWISIFWLECNTHISE